MEKHDHLFSFIAYKKPIQTSYFRTFISLFLLSLHHSLDEICCQKHFNKIMQENASDHRKNPNYEENVVLSFAQAGWFFSHVGADDNCYYPGENYEHYLQGDAFVRHVQRFFSRRAVVFFQVTHPHSCGLSVLFQVYIQVCLFVCFFCRYGLALLSLSENCWFFWELSFTSKVQDKMWYRKHKEAKK